MSAKKLFMSSFEGGYELDGATHGDNRSRAGSSSSAASSGSLEGSGKSREGPQEAEKSKGRRKSITSRLRSAFSYLTGRKSPSPAPSPSGGTRVESKEDGAMPQMVALLEDPVLIGKYDILNLNMAKALRVHLPETIQIQSFKLVYSLYNHGTELATFFKNARGSDYTLLLIETINGSVFGGFCSREWKPTGSYFGTGESFIFSIREEGGEYSIGTYKWTTRNNYFCFADHEKIAMGGGGGGFGFVVDADLHSCGSSPCDTYGNTSTLDLNKEGNAPVSRIANVELWSFQLGN